MHGTKQETTAAPQEIPHRADPISISLRKTMLDEDAAREKWFVSGAGRQVSRH